MMNSSFGNRVMEMFQTMFGRGAVEEQCPSDSAKMSGHVFGLKTSDWHPTHRHIKGGEYRVLMHGILETDRSEVVIYDDAKRTVWVRPKLEFYDGRFATIDSFQTPAERP